MFEQGDIYLFISAHSQIMLNINLPKKNLFSWKCSNHAMVNIFLRILMDPVFFIYIEVIKAIKTYEPGDWWQFHICSFVKMAYRRCEWFLAHWHFPFNEITFIRRKESVIIWLRLMMLENGMKQMNELVSIFHGQLACASQGKSQCSKIHFRAITAFRFAPNYKMKNKTWNS